MIVDSLSKLSKLIAKSYKSSPLWGRRFADSIFPNSTKIYRVLMGPGRNLKFSLNARKQTSFLFGLYERANINFLLSRVSDDTAFWDVGAHIGYFSCIMARKISANCVVAIEPFPDNIKLLRQSIALNDLKNIIVIEKALSSKEGEALFLVNPDSNSMGHIIHNPPDSHAQTVRVSVSTIDSLVNSGLPVPDIIKVDAEGEEGLILKGAVEILEKQRPCWLIEVQDPENTEVCWNILSQHRYNVWLLRRYLLKKPREPRDICGKHIWAEPRR